MNNPHTLTCSVALEDSQLPLAGLGTEPLPSASKTTTAPESSTDIGPASQSSETSGSSTAASGAEPDCSQGDFLASHGAKPGSKEAMQMTVRSGLKCCVLLKKPDPISCLQRMLLASSTWHSTMCFLNWKAKGTPQGRLYFQLAPSTPRTDETEFGLWPTPTANEDAAGTPQGKMQPMLGNHPDVRNTGVGTLNPTWVEWLMGYPIGHTDLKPLETQ